MQIEKENIESFIFDYHEGNLSDSEKTEVLNYIHNHPEYEVEFTKWAQSYLPYESTIKNYGLTNTLIQNPTTAWYNKSWIKITVPILIISFISFFYVSTKESTSVSTSPTHNTEQHSIVELKTNTTTELKSTDKNKTMQKQTPVVATNSQIVNTSRPTIIHSINESPISSSLIESTPTSDVNAPKNIQEDKKQVSDSVTTNTNVAEPNKKADTNKKKKSYKIKPTTDFIPTNPNF